MDRTEYQAEPAVLRFVEWAGPIVAGERTLRHSWSSPRFGQWSFGSLSEACARFSWRFSLAFPGEDRRRRGQSLDDNLAALRELGGILRDSVARGDPAGFLDGVVAVADWGGLRRSIGTFRAMGDEAFPTIMAAAPGLDPAHADTSDLSTVRHLNSTYSKVYALLLDGFPIYDSRVACALASLVRLHCAESELAAVPAPLAFRQPSSRVDGRNPSRGTLRFAPLWYGQPREYACANLYAAWLLELLVGSGEFGSFARPEGVLRLQSALFMLGYLPLDDNALI